MTIIRPTEQTRPDAAVQGFTVVCGGRRRAGRKVRGHLCQLSASHCSCHSLVSALLPLWPLLLLWPPLATHLQLLLLALFFFFFFFCSSNYRPSALFPSCVNGAMGGEEEWLEFISQVISDIWQAHTHARTHTRKHIERERERGAEKSSIQQSVCTVWILINQSEAISARYQRLLAAMATKEALLLMQDGEEVLCCVFVCLCGYQFISTFRPVLTLFWL